MPAFEPILDKLLVLALVVGVAFLVHKHGPYVLVPITIVVLANVADYINKPREIE